jgi:hypothetical protein
VSLVQALGAACQSAGQLLPALHQQHMEQQAQVAAAAGSSGMDTDDDSVQQQRQQLEACCRLAGALEHCWLQVQVRPVACLWSMSMPELEITVINHLAHPSYVLCISATAESHLSQSACLRHADTYPPTLCLLRNRQASQRRLQQGRSRRAQQRQWPRQGKGRVPAAASRRHRARLLPRPAPLVPALPLATCLGAMQSTCQSS